ncbi:MAG TPA: type II toxin-antitoxin system MqsA family antitoxin [Chloroflexota bacterium]|nr:type II toxin-antitoxin system MqsA family antitoxin [Chloroflexota bacterium]
MGARLREEESSLKCVICKHGETRSGHATVTLSRGEMTLVVKKVPAVICSTCGEEYVDDDIMQRLLETAASALRSGVQVDVRDFVAA